MYRKGAYLKNCSAKHILLFFQWEYLAPPIPYKFHAPSQGSSIFSQPNVYSRYNKIEVYMEGPYLRKWGAKHIYLYTVGVPYPKQCTLKISGPYSGAFDISEPDVYSR